MRGEHNIRGKKAIMCFEGETIRVPKDKRKKWLRKGATRGKCPPCTPVCPTDGTCGSDDGCGGTCDCPAGSFCREATCVVCDVTCTGNAEACGASLSEALLGGGTIQLCPGLYGGQFVISVGETELIGAGNGDDPATSSILDGQQGGVTLEFLAGVDSSVANLRITGGQGEAGGGISIAEGVFAGPANTVTNCVVTGNSASGNGGGIYSPAEMFLYDSEITSNTAGGDGGGIFARAYTAEFIVSNSLISGNTASGTGGGGVFRRSVQHDHFRFGGQQ